MANEPKRIYWDSVVFIDFLQQTKWRIDSIGPMAEEARRGDLIIVTSALTLAEVVSLKDLGLLDLHTEQLIVDFFESEFIEVRNVDRFIAEKARWIIREFKINAPDAIHVATAILEKVAVLFTYDFKDLAKWDGKIDGLPIKIPGDTSEE
jgi:predicted nucleic acid-binding protein